LAGVRYQFEQVEGDVRNDKGQGEPDIQKQVTINEPIFRLGLNYQAAQGTFLRASFGQAVRSPSVAERFTTTQAGPINVIPAPDILIEKGFTAEVGVKQLFMIGKKFTGFVDVSGFLMEFRNMVEFYVDTDELLENRFLAFKAQNVSNATVTGVEAMANFNYKFNDDASVNFGGGVTWINPRDRDGDPSIDGDENIDKFLEAAVIALTGGQLDGPFPEDRPAFLKYRNEWMARSSISFLYKHWTFTVNHRYTSEQVNVDKIFLLPPVFPGTLEFRKRNPGGWNEFDFILAYRVHGITISGHVFNAFNEEFMTIPGTLGEHRRFAMQLQVQF
jgi:outer membrane receptor protein involved in Fe transport